MKQVITILIVIGLIYFGKQFNAYWKDVKAKNAPEDQKVAAPAAPAVMPGLPPAMEPALAAAQARGTLALKQWLDQNRRFITDPRLAAIELDYVVLVAPSNRAEARQVLASLSQRVRPDSPVYGRLKKLEQTYLQ